MRVRVHEGERARGVRALLAIFLAVLMAGCETTPWVRGGIAEGLPKHVEKFPKDMAFYVGKTEKRVKTAFEESLRKRGFEVVAKKLESDVIVNVTVDSWEYNDVGFGGFRPRDDMELTVSCVDRRKNRVLARAKISVRSDFRIISKYVDSL